MEKWTSARKAGTAGLIGIWMLSLMNGAGAADDGPNPAPPPASVVSAITPEIMKSIRAATFEVVLKKPENDPLAYEKPLPLDLLPFAQRNDKYESIGTAFAIAPDSFVTAAHVTGAASGSMWGVPALRDAQGNVYPINKVTRFSLGEDFIVFTANGAPHATPLPTSTDVALDTPVLAVGNALGEGVVARDGLLTSETPEEQDGRWKWLRFSAPASPGNSGGPLLDAKGRVIGVIERKSPNENLNYALPISLVLDAPANKAILQSRMAISLPFMASSREIVKLDTAFRLPLSFSDFDRQLLDAQNGFAGKQFEDMPRRSADQIFPRGKSARLLADGFDAANPALVVEQSDGHWDVPRSMKGVSAQLGNDGLAWVSAEANTLLFRILYPSDLDVTSSRGDSKLLGEQILKAVNIPRQVATERIRVTSLGDVGKPDLLKDDRGRVWQQWRYPLPFADSTLLVAALPTPDGYVGMIRLAKGFALVATLSDLKLLTNMFETPYRGTLAQWRAFLADAKLRPEPFAKWHAALDPAGDVSLELPRLTMKVDKQVLAPTEHSVLRVLPGMVMQGDKAAWDVVGVTLALDESPNSARLTALRYARPAPDAGQDLVSRWEDMTLLRGRYSEMPRRNPNSFWITKVVAAEGTPLTAADFLYDLTYTTPTLDVPGEVRRAGEKLPNMFLIHEK